MHGGRSRTLSGLAVLSLAGAVLPGCGASGQPKHHSEPRRYLTPVPLIAGAPMSSSAPSSLRRGALPRVGAAQRVDAAGAELTVTLRSVTDPLRGSGARLPRGHRTVGVVVQIRNAGPKPYDSSATGDIRLVASGGAVTPVLATRGICKTPLDDFDRYITAGEDRVGCVAFAVANGATLDAVWFSPHAHRLGRLTWAP